MPPQALRPPGPAPEEAVESGGRHRRAQTLADTRRSRVTMEGTLPPRHTRTADARIAVPLQRNPRHQRAAFVDGSGFAGPRHSSGHRAPDNGRPFTGSHRAPGTLPIESWLLMGKKRQQALLAGLVAVGVLLVALPVENKTDNVDAVRAAQQRAATQGAKKGQGGDPAQRTGQNSAGQTDGNPAPAVSASADAPVGDSARSGAPRPTGRNAGPAHSLRTTGARTVALTFDDGPDPVQTPKLLALLDKYQVKATFCLVGEQVEKHPEIVRQIATAGHTLCNHTWNHSLTIGKAKPADIRADLERTSDAIQAAVPGASVPFFRAPGGNFTDRLVSVAGEHGMTSLYWEVDPRDWDHPEKETDAQHVKRVVAEVRQHVRAGSIVLSHDFNQPDTVEAYEQLLPWLADHFTLGIPGQRPSAGSPPPATASPAVPEPTESASPAPSPSDQPLA